MLVIDISSNDHKLLFFLMSEERDLNANVSAVSHRLSSMTDERDLLQANLTEKTKELEGLHFLFYQSESLYEVLCVFKKNLQTHINLFFFLKRKKTRKKNPQQVDLVLYFVLLPHYLDLVQVYFRCCFSYFGCSNILISHFALDKKKNYFRSNIHKRVTLKTLVCLY